MRSRHAILLLLLLLAWPASKAAAFLVRIVSGTTITQSITTVSLSNASYVTGSSVGTTVGAISVTLSPAAPAFSGTLSLSGAAATDFSLSRTSLPANLITNGNTATCSTPTTYNINIIATQGGTQGSPFSMPETITCVTNCPQGSAYADGCPAAVAAATQFPAILSTTVTPPYTAGPYHVRPAWNVAGVDYSVGIPLGTVLQDPATASLPSGASYSGTAIDTLTLSGSGGTIQNLDFGLHNGTGTRLIINAGAWTIKNNHFIVGTNSPTSGASLFNALTGAGNTTVINNEFDGNNIANVAQAGTAVSFYNSGTATIEYNYFHNCGGDCVDFNRSTTAATHVIRYNLTKDFSVNTAHADSWQWYDTQVAGGDVGFNTVYETTITGNMGNGLMTYPSEGTGGTVSNLDFHNNTLLATSACTGCNWGTGYYEDTGGTGDHVTFRNSYIDPTGINDNTASPYFGTQRSGSGGYTGVNPNPASYHDLIDMTTGSVIPVPSVSSQTPFRWYVYPDANGLSPALSDIYSITPSPATGNITTGNSITFTLAMTVPMTVSGTPIISLNSGGTANYSSGSGTSSLVFSYTVGSSDNATTLAVNSVNLNGGTITDPYGNAAQLSNLSTITTSFTGLSVTGTGASCAYSGNNVQDSAGNTDGCSGSNSASAYSIPNLFTGYVSGTTYTNSHPPNWDVAGLDYPVGPYTATASLIACTSSSSCPTTGVSPSGCATVSGTNMTINSAPCTVKGYHFTGMCLTWSNSITSGVITVTDNLFTLAAGCNPSSTVFNGSAGTNAGSQEYVVTYNAFDLTYTRTDTSCGGGACVSQPIALSGGGTGSPSPAVLFEYNIVFNNTGHGLYLDSHNTGGSVAEIHYNLFQDLGGPGSHSDNPYFGGAAGFDYYVHGSFNTSVYTHTGYSQTATWTYSSQQGSGFIQIGGYNENNVMIINRPSTGTAGGMIYIAQTGSNLPNEIVQNNWVDSTSTNGFLFGGQVTPFTCTGNKNLITGAEIVQSGVCN